jgi:isoamylase
MVFLNGDAIPEPDNLGRRISDDHFLLMFNASAGPVEFTTPAEVYGDSWTVRLDTATGGVDPGVEPWGSRTTHTVPGHSMVVLSTAAVPESARQEAERRADEVRPTFAKVSAQA